jgi:CDP-4-dehydro-6-deoxyglucose reductase
LRILVANSGRSFDAAPEQTLLDAALDAKLNLPHSCKSGNCGACRALLLKGEVHYASGSPLGLTDAEIAEHSILLCQARARTDLKIEIFEIRAADTPAVQRLPCRIERAQPLSHDVMGLFLRLPEAVDFVFEAGQYLDVILPGGRRRSFSIVSPPHDARPLELHVRRVQGGEFTERLFHEDTANSLLTIEGPLGQFTYRPHVVESSATGARSTSALPATSAPPMLLIGGGTGIAPLLSILRHVVDNGIERDMTLYWGVRGEQDLYAKSTLQALSRRAAHLKVVPVLSEATPAWAGLTGFVHEAALQGIENLGDLEVYAAGPPAMIAAVRRAYDLRGVDRSRLYFDSFDYAPDTLERQRMSAATRS